MFFYNSKKLQAALPIQICKNKMYNKANTKKQTNKQTKKNKHRKKTKQNTDPKLIKSYLLLFLSPAYIEGKNQRHMVATSIILIV